MDEMELWEADLMYENLKYANSTDWETTRLLAYMMAAPYMKQKKSLTEFLPLPTDKMQDTHSEASHEITKQDIENLRAESKKFEKLFKQGKLKV